MSLTSLCYYFARGEFHETLLNLHPQTKLICLVVSLFMKVANEQSVYFTLKEYFMLKESDPKILVSLKIMSYPCIWSMREDSWLPNHRNFTNITHDIVSIDFRLFGEVCLRLSKLSSKFEVSLVSL